MSFWAQPGTRVNELRPNVGLTGDKCHKFRLETKEEKIMENQKSALGLDANITALIGYLIGLVAIIVFFIEKENKFVKFHAIQSVLFHVGMVVLMVAVSIVTGVLSQISGAFALVGLLALPLWLIWLVGMIFLAFKSFKGEMFKFPVIGNIAEGMANK